MRTGACGLHGETLRIAHCVISFGHAPSNSIVVGMLDDELRVDRRSINNGIEEGTTMTDDSQNSLRREPTRSTLDRLHAQARKDRFNFLGLAPRFLAGLIASGNFSEQITPDVMKEFFIPIRREQGEFLYITARAIDARNVVESARPSASRRSISRRRSRTTMGDE